MFGIEMKSLLGSATEIKEAFVTGFEEGLVEFWSPFVGLANALKRSWRSRLVTPTINQGKSP